MGAGSGGGPLPEESQDREQQIPQLAEADLQPAGGSVAALESPSQAFDQRERGMGQQVRPVQTFLQFQSLKHLLRVQSFNVSYLQSAVRGELEAVQC